MVVVKYKAKNIQQRIDYLSREEDNFLIKKQQLHFKKLNDK